MNYKDKSLRKVNFDVEETMESLKDRSKSLPRPNVFGFSNASDLLNDWFEFLQSKDETYTLRYVAKISGLSAGFLSYVLTGKRSLSDKAFDKLKTHLKMKNEEVAYLDVIRKLSGNFNHKDKAQAFEVAQRIRAYTDENPEATETYSYLSNWLHIAIREMAQFTDFKDDPKWIKKQLNFEASVKDISSALQFLKETNLISKNKDGSFSVNVKNIGCNDEVFRLAINNYHKEMLQRAYDAQVDLRGLDKRALRGRTLAITMDQYERILKIIEQLDNEIEKIDNEDAGPAEVVTQLEIAVFNFAQSTNIKKGKKS